MILSYFLAIAAAGANAASNVLQRRANREEPPELSLRLGLILDLVRRPIWLAGLATVITSFVLMAAALSMGRLAAVQPIVVLELPLTLIGAALTLGARLGVREWGAVVAMTLALAGLIAFLSPSGGTHGHASALTWAIAIGATGLGIATCALVAIKSSEARRPALLGVATGMTFGLTAALMKGMTASFDHGIVGVLTSWQTYAMAFSGLLGMYLMQNALHEGKLITAQPGITLTDPAVAIVWGIVVFHESTRGGFFILLTVLSAAVLAAAAIVLARSPVLIEHASGGKGGAKGAKGAKGNGRSGGKGGKGGKGSTRPGGGRNPDRDRSNGDGKQTGRSGRNRPPEDRAAASSAHD